MTFAVAKRANGCLSWPNSSAALDRKHALSQEDVWVSGGTAPWAFSRSGRYIPGTGGWLGTRRGLAALIPAGNTPTSSDDRPVSLLLCRLR
jgi:hypothetical protein